jgi:hypothetical protein
VLGRQEQQSKHTECGENSDELPANASWHHRPLSVRVNWPSIGQVKLARNLEREQVVVNHPRSLRFGAPAVDRVVDRHVVLERIGARHVVVIGIPGTPDQPAGLILAAGDWFELHFDEAVLQAVSSSMQTGYVA